VPLWEPCVRVPQVKLGHKLTEYVTAEALDERVGSARLFTTATTQYNNAVNEIDAVKLDLINLKPQKLSMEDLQKLRTVLVSKFSTAKTQIDHSKLNFDNLVQEIEELKKYLSPESISIRKEELMKNRLELRKKIDNLSKKKIEIREINRVIDSFNRTQEVNYSEEELSEIFGDQAEAIKTRPGVFKKTSKIRVKKEKVEDNSEDIKQADTEAVDDQKKNEMKEEDSTEKLKTSPKERPEESEYEFKDITTYGFKINLSQSVHKLQDTQAKLKQSIERYEKEIQDIKQAYIENVKKFESIKKVLGYENEEEQDVEMGEANGVEEAHQHDDHGREEGLGPDHEGDVTIGGADERGEGEDDGSEGEDADDPYR